MYYCEPLKGRNNFPASQEIAYPAGMLRDRRFAPRNDKEIQPFPARLSFRLPGKRYSWDFIFGGKVCGAMASPEGIR